MNEDPRWALVLARLRAGESLRKVAAEFGTNPRRLRRALARASIRVRGESLGRDGVPALVRFRSRLGKEPDGAIARDARVTPEAVQGERKRLGIPAFRPRPKVHLSAEEEEWIRGPVREPSLPPRRERQVVGPVVVRKAQRDGGSVIRRVAPSAAPEVGAPVAGSPPAGPPQAPSAAPSPEPRGPRLAWGVLAFRANEPASAVRTIEPRPFPARPLTEREEEMQRFLNAPRRERTSRERIIRTESRPFEVSAPSPPPSAPAPSAPAARRTRAPAWRAADPELMAALAREAELEAAATAAKREAEAAAEAATAAKAAAEREAAREEAMRREAAREAARAEAAAEEAAAARAANEAAAAERAALAAAKRAAAAIRAPAIVVSPPASPGLMLEGARWAVRYAGLDVTLSVHAGDVVSALVVAQASLPGFTVVSIAAR